MELLRDFFVGLSRFVRGAIEYMVDGILNDPAYREGFCAGAVFLFVVLVFSQLVPWAWNRVLAYFAARQPSLVPTPAASRVGRGCVIGAVILAVLAFLGAGIVIGVLEG